MSKEAASSSSHQLLGEGGGERALGGSRGSTKGCRDRKSLPRSLLRVQIGCCAEATLLLVNLHIINTQVTAVSLLYGFMLDEQARQNRR